jgi:acetamidase/formamidase family protein
VLVLGYFWIRLAYRPEPAEFAWTFGGVPPVRRVRSGSLLELWTEDAFGGRVRGPDDLVSRVVEFPFVNPQTGPFYVEGAEPGDTLAIHFVSIEPSWDWAASTTVPLFGALTGTHATALLQEPLPEVVWIYEVDRRRRTVTFRAPARRAGRRAGAGPDARDGGGRAGLLRGPLVAGPRPPRRQHGPAAAGRALRRRAWPPAPAGARLPGRAGLRRALRWR